MPRIVAAAARFPERYFSQEDVAQEFLRVAGGRGEVTAERVTRLFTNVGVSGRHMVLPLAQYPRLGGFAERSAIWLEHALELGACAVTDALARAGLPPGDVSLFASSTVTGIAVPSLESRLMTRLGCAPSCRRLPLFGLGCVAGAAGIARVSEAPSAAGRRTRPSSYASSCAHSRFSCQTSRSPTSSRRPSLVTPRPASSWSATSTRLRRPRPDRASSTQNPCCFPAPSEPWAGTSSTRDSASCSADSVPALARCEFADAARAFLDRHGLTPSGINTWVAHPGGPAVIDALEQGLGLGSGTLDASRRALANVGNLSSASVIALLADALHGGERPAAGPGVLFAMGPGFSAELVLLEW